jgi:hypothetical protein
LHTEHEALVTPSAFDGIATTKGQLAKIVVGWGVLAGVLVLLLLGAVVVVVAETVVVDAAVGATVVVATYPCPAAHVQYIPAGLHG